MTGDDRQGTRDLAACLAVPKAIATHAGFDLERMRELAQDAELRLERIPGEPAPFMRAFELPREDPDELRQRLFEEFRVEVPVYEWSERVVLRVSIGPYNDEEDVDRLVAALEELLPSAESRRALRER